MNPNATTAALVPGTPMQGGFYFGRMRIAGELFGLVAAPKAEADIETAWSPTDADIEGARSFLDGLANTTAMAEAGVPLAKWAQALAIGGHLDWYVPSRDELELMYRAFKPGQEENYGYRSGENPSADPPTYAYTDTEPAQTSALAFQEGGAEALETRWYWSSTQFSAGYAWIQDFGDGGQLNGVKQYEGRARAVRRFSID